jgi:hypothetical protein
MLAPAAVTALAAGDRIEADAWREVADTRLEDLPWSRCLDLTYLGPPVYDFEAAGGVILVDPSEIPAR